MKIEKRTLILTIACIIIGLLLIFLLRPKEELIKVAIVIDDWGYNLHHLDFLKEIDVPVSISILPNLKYSSKIAEVAEAQGKEIILHLPLEPEREGRIIRLEEHTILTDMPKDEIIKKVELALTSVPYACGVSNHMGSRATADLRIMSIVFGRLKKRRLFFLDNRVTDKSICKQLAKKMGVKFAQRDFFLDNLDNYEYIKEQFMKFIEFAQQNGQAVGIGHARLKTLRILTDVIAQMQKEKIKFVFVSDLVE